MGKEDQGWVQCDFSHLAPRHRSSWRRPELATFRTMLSKQARTSWNHVLSLKPMTTALNMNISGYVVGTLAAHVWIASTRHLTRKSPLRLRAANLAGDYYIAALNVTGPNLWFSAKICGFLRFPAPSKCLNFQEKT